MITLFLEKSPLALLILTAMCSQAIEFVFLTASKPWINIAAMKNYKHKALEAAQFLKDHIEKLPKIGLLTGTGLGESAAALDISISFEYKDIPHFPATTVESHFGRLLFGSIQDKPIIAMQGRFHLYEGYSPLEVTLPVRIMQELGVKILILSNAAGGLTPGLQTGDLMIITDHINLTGSNPLVGPNEESWGARFPDMTEAYDKQLIALAENAAKDAGIRLHKGVYAGLQGPSLETPAEVRFLQTIGADAVGFSTVQEVIAAVHAGIQVLGLSIITNVHDPDAPTPAVVKDIIAVAKDTAPGLAAIIRQVAIKV
jgi:purine-nucleoside phosphorylase